MLTQLDQQTEENLNQSITQSVKQGNYSAVAILVLIVIAVSSFMWQQHLLSAIQRQNDEIISQLQTQIDFLKQALMKPGKLGGEILGAASDQSTSTNKYFQTYTNSNYGFAFEYPSNLIITEKNGSYGAEKLVIKLNYDNNLPESYHVIVLDAGNKSTKELIHSQYDLAGNGPSNISDVVINGLSAVKFFMEIANASGPAGSAYVLFKNKTTAVIISTNARTGSTTQNMSSFLDSLSNDAVLNSIASSFKFIN
jgi:hypothetical protein